MSHHDQLLVILTITGLFALALAIKWLLHYGRAHDPRPVPDDRDSWADAEVAGWATDRDR